MKVVSSVRARDALTRLAAFLLEQVSVDPSEAIEAIIDAVTALERNPFIGWPVAGAGHRLGELVISYGRTGYVALHRVHHGRVEVLALRHQREAGYADD